MLEAYYTEKAFREIRRMVVAGSGVLLLTGACAGVFLEKVRRDTVARELAAAETFRAMMKRMEAADASYAKLRTDNALLANENESVRSAVDQALREHDLAMDRMKGLTARLQVFGAVIAKNIETVKMPGETPRDLRDAPNDPDASTPLSASTKKIAELERKLDLSRRSTLYFMRYAESLSDRKADPKEREALLQMALNGMSVTEKQYQDLGGKTSEER